MGISGNESSHRPPPLGYFQLFMEMCSRDELSDGNSKNKTTVEITGYSHLRKKFFSVFTFSVSTTYFSGNFLCLPRLVCSGSRTFHYGAASVAVGGKIFRFRQPRLIWHGANMQVVLWKRNDDIFLAKYPIKFEANFVFRG